jgi:Domain of unknown function (DUF4129)
MTSTAVRVSTIWLVMAMEAVFAAVLLGGVVARTDPPLVGELAALIMLPVGYLALETIPMLEDVRTRLVAGVVISLGLRLLATMSEPSPQARLLGAIVPTVVGLGLWWRGSALATAELTANDVRDEFLALGVALLGLLTLLRLFLGLSGPGLLLALVLFVGFGLLAVGMARQDGAGSPGSGASRLLEIGAVLAVLGAGIVLLAVLQPQLIIALWEGLGLLLSVIGTILLFLLQPLLTLLSHIPLTLPALPFGQLPLGLPRVPQPQPAQPPPMWLVWLIVVLVALMTVLFVAVVLALILLALAAVSRRGQRAAEAAAIVDIEGGAGEDARALLAGLRRWLARLRRGPALPMRRSTLELDSARAAYRALLRWAKEKGLDRAPAETTQEFRARLDAQLPQGRPTYATITDTYELERYGDLPAPRDRLRLLQVELEALHNPTTPTPDKHGT